MEGPTVAASLRPPESAMQSDEPEIIEAAAKGDHEAFGMIVSRYMPRALGFARAMTGNAEDARDMAQEAFVKAYRSLGTFRGQSGFRTWFFSVLANVCTDHLRKRALMNRIIFFRSGRKQDDGADDPPVAADTHWESMPDRGAERRELGAALGRALLRLPGRQRAVFLMKHHEEMKLREIAAALGISEGAVKSHLVRAVAALRKEMRDYKSHG